MPWGSYNIEGEVILENPHTEGHAQNNGEAEKAAGMIAGHVRTLKEACEHYLQLKIPQDSPFLAWIVSYAGTLLTR